MQEFRMLKKLKKEYDRIHRRVFRSGDKDQRIEMLQAAIDNLPYELLDERVRSRPDYYIPKIKTIDETLEILLQENCSIARFGDGEFNVLNSGRIHFQERSPKMAERLKEVLASRHPRLLIGLVDTFGDLSAHTQAGIDFWRKWMSRKRAIVYSYLDRERVYDNALFTRPYIIFNKNEQHYRDCEAYFEKVRKLWAGRNVVICEGEGTRFGLFNDLLEGAASIRRILCPARNAFDQYDRILAAFDDVDTQSLVLAALGPTATVLAHDLCVRGFQSIDIGHLDLEYEWFLTKDTEGRPVAFKYVDGLKEGRQVHAVDNPVYQRQIWKTIL